MTIEHKLHRVEFPDDPKRCKGVGAHGQCPYEAMPGFEYCARHGNNTEMRKQEMEEMRNYRLAKWQARLNQFADHPKVKTLREEIGILRMLLEETMNRCNDADDLFLLSNKISELVSKVERVVISCHKLEQSSGQVLDKTAVLSFAAQVVEIISNHVNDVAVIDMITNDILNTLQER